MQKTLESVSNMLDLDVSDINRIAEIKSQAFVEGNITTSQIRNIFSEIGRIRNEFDKGGYERARKPMILLKPKLAYAVGRQQKKDQKDTMNEYKNTFYKLIELVEKTESDRQADAMQMFFDFAEAIVAYHKYYEKNKNNN